MDSPQSLLFYLIAIMTGLCAIAVVVSQNIVRSATWLLFTLAGTSGIFFLLGADLVGTIQLLVYVGGTLVLLVFGVMLTAQGPFINMRTSSAEWAISALVGILLLGVLSVGIMRIGKPAPPAKSTVAMYAPKAPLVEGSPALVKLKADYAGKTLSKEEKAEYERQLTALLHDEPKNASYSAVLGQGFLGVGVGPAHDAAKGKVVRATYLLPFEIVSVHLLVVLIGAAYLARAKRRRRVAS